MHAAADEIEKIWKLISKIRTCMLVSADGAQLHARPMSAYGDRQENVIYFLTEASGADERSVEVCLTFAEGSHYLSISGQSTVSNDRDRIGELWNVFAEAWFDGPNDPDVRLLCVRPREARYWETPGKLATIVSMIVAAASGARPDIGTDRTVDMH